MRSEELALDVERAPSTAGLHNRSCKCTSYNMEVKSRPCLVNRQAVGMTEHCMHLSFVNHRCSKLLGVRTASINASRLYKPFGFFNFVDPERILDTGPILIFAYALQTADK